MIVISFDSFSLSLSLALCLVRCTFISVGSRSSWRRRTAVVVALGEEKKIFESLAVFWAVWFETGKQPFSRWTAEVFHILGGGGGGGQPGSAESLEPNAISLASTSNMPP